MHWRHLNGWAVLVAATLGAGPAWAANEGHVGREGRWEFSLGPAVQLSETIDFRGGAEVEADDHFGFVFGFGYHVNPQLMLGVEFGWNNPDYDASVPSADEPPADPAASFGKIDLASVYGTFTWHVLAGPVTPYVSGGVGWTWIETEIRSSPPQVGCWWDPWFGYSCQRFFPTRTEDAFGYRLGGGFRWDFGSGRAYGGYGWFTRLGYERRWVDFDNARGTPGFDALRLEIGAKF